MKEGRRGREKKNRIPCGVELVWGLSLGDLLDEKLFNRLIKYIRKWDKGFGLLGYTNQ